MPQADVIFVHGLVSDLFRNRMMSIPSRSRGGLGYLRRILQTTNKAMHPGAVWRTAGADVLSNAGDHLHIDSRTPRSQPGSLRIDLCLPHRKEDYHDHQSRLLTTRYSGSSIASARRDAELSHVGPDTPCGEYFAPLLAAGLLFRRN